MSGSEAKNQLFKDPQTLSSVEILRQLPVVARLGYPENSIGINTPQVNFTVEALDSLLGLLQNAHSPNESTLGIREYGFFGLGRRDGNSVYVDSWYLLDESFKADGGAKHFSDSTIAAALTVADANNLDVVIRAHDHHNAARPEPSAVDINELFIGAGFVDLIVQSTRDPFTLGVYCPGQAAGSVENLGINIVNPRSRSQENVNTLLTQFAYYMGNEQVQLTNQEGSQYIADYSNTVQVKRGEPHSNIPPTISIEDEVISIENVKPVEEGIPEETITIDLEENQSEAEPQSLSVDDELSRLDSLEIETMMGISKVKKRNAIQRFFDNFKP